MGIVQRSWRIIYPSAQVAPAQTRPLCSKGISRPWGWTHLVTVDEMRCGLFRVDPNRHEPSVGDKALDSQVAVILIRDSERGIGPDLHGDDHVFHNAGSIEQMALEGPITVRRRKVVVLHLPEVAPGVLERVRITNVHPILVPRSRRVPCTDIVTRLDLEGGHIVGVDGRDPGLRGELALVHPHSAADDGDAVGLKHVDHDLRALLDVLRGDVDVEGHAPKVEGPAPFHEVEDDVLALDRVGVGAGGYDGAELVAVGSWGDLHEFGGRGAVLAKVFHPVGEVAAVELAGCFGRVDCCVRRYGCVVLGCFDMIVVEWGWGLAIL